MSQFSNKLLRHLQSEYLTSGKTHFSFPDMLECLPDPKQLELAIETLQRTGSLRKTEYVNDFELLELPN